MSGSLRHGLDNFTHHHHRALKQHQTTPPQYRITCQCSSTRLRRRQPMPTITVAPPCGLGITPPQARRQQRHIGRCAHHTSCPTMVARNCGVFPQSIRRHPYLAGWSWPPLSHLPVIGFKGSTQVATTRSKCNCSNTCAHKCGMLLVIHWPTSDTAAAISKESFRHKPDTAQHAGGPSITYSPLLTHAADHRKLPGHWYVARRLGPSCLAAAGQGPR
jgi:hypothetical protein